MNENYERPESKLIRELKSEIQNADRLREQERQESDKTISELKREIVGKDKLIQSLQERESELKGKLKNAEDSSSALSASLQEWEGYLEERGIGSLESLKKLEDENRRKQDSLKAVLKAYSDLPNPEEYRKAVEAVAGREKALQKRENDLNEDLHVKAWRRGCKALLVALLVALVFFTVFLFLLSGWLSGGEGSMEWSIPRIFGAIKSWILYSLRQ